MLIDLDHLESRPEEIAHLLGKHLLDLQREHCQLKELTCCESSVRFGQRPAFARVL